MKRILQTSVLVMLFALVTAVANANTAKLQVIHNAADPAAGIVDIYLNNQLLLNDFAFRSATPFVEVPANVPHVIGVAPGNSTSPNDILASFTVTLAHNKKYVAIATGVLNPANFSANPDGINIGFNLFTRDRVRESANNRNLVDLLIFHGATDAPTVDILSRGAYDRKLVNNLTYGQFSGYKTVMPSRYTLDITPGSNNNMVVASFEADLSGLRGGSAIVFASGFLVPESNQNGASFGLFAALPNGAVVELPREVPQARLQVIHNAADPAASAVDIYVNDQLLLNDFAFRAATPFIDVPAGVTLNIGVAPSNSASPNDIIAAFPVVLENDNKYVLIANGVLNPSSFAVNPEGLNVGFNLYPFGHAREESNWRNFVDLLVFHGATDAPTVDVWVRGWRFFPLVNDLNYGEYAGYKPVLPLNYTLDITPGNDRNTVVASYRVDLTGLRNGAAVVFASGFLNPANNQNGPAFGLYVALPSGQVLALPSANGLLKPSDEISEAIPAEYTLEQNYPNPFNPTTTIAFTLPVASNVSLKVFNVLGQEIETLVDNYMDAGLHQVTFNAAKYPSGVYFYRLDSGSESLTKKMMLVK